VIDPFEVYAKKGVKIPSSRVALLFHPKLFRIAKRMLENASSVKFSGVVFKSAVGRYSGVEVFITLPFWGAPAAAAGLEALIATGGRLFIAVGRAGSLSPKLRVGDILIPTWGIREEGTSYHYLPPDVVPKPDAELARALYAEARVVKGRKRIRVLRGGIWSTDALFRETEDKVAEYSKLGALGVDMESTALMSVAMYRGVRLAVIAAISDELYGGLWRPGYKTRRLARAERVVVEAALRVLAKQDL